MKVMSVVGKRRGRDEAKGEPQVGEVYLLLRGELSLGSAKERNLIVVIFSASFAKREFGCKLCDSSVTPVTVFDASEWRLRGFPNCPSLTAKP